MADFLNGSDGGTGIPPELLKRRNGLMQALLSIPEDQDAGMGTASAVPNADVGGAGGGSEPKLDRIEDDRTRHPQGDPQPESLAEKMNAGDYSGVQMGQQGQQEPRAQPQTLSDKMNAGDYSSLQFGQQGRPAGDDLLAKLQTQYDDLGKPRPMKLWQKMLLGASAPFGGLTGYAQAKQRGQQMRVGQQEKLLDTITALKRQQEQEQFETNKPYNLEHLDTDQGPISFNPRTGEALPITVGGQRVGTKAQPKPDTPEQQFFDSPEEQGKTLAQKLKDYTAATQKPETRPDQIEQQFIDSPEEAGKTLKQKLADYAAATQKPEHEQRQLAVAPDGTVIELRPGVKVAPGTVTASQYGPEQTKLNQQAAMASTTVNSFNRYQQSFRTLAPQLTENDRRALQVLSSHEQVAQGFLAKATSGVLDTLFGEPLTGYSEKAMGGIMTKDQYDKLSPAGKKMLADYFNAVIQNFGNMKQLLGSIGRNPMQLQAEINTIPLPYIDGQTAETMFADKLEDLQTRNKGLPQFNASPNASNPTKDLGAAPPGATDGSIVRNRVTGARGRVQGGRIVSLATNTVR